MTDAPYVRLFGGPLVVEGDMQPALSPTQRRLLAVVYAHAPDPVTREEVCWLLWEEGETPEARHRLRQLIYEINRPLSTPALERRGDLIVACLPTDVHDVEPTLSPPLRLVTAAGHASFEHWLDAARNRLANHRERRLAAQLDEALRVKNWRRAFDVVRSVLFTTTRGAPWVDNLVESAIRSGSIHEGRVLVNQLAEVGVLTQSESHDATNRLVAVPEQIRTPSSGLHRMHGREQELAWLWQRSTPLTGRNFTFIQGPAGIGKTRLLEELALKATSEGIHIAFVTLRQALSESPFSAVSEIYTGLDAYQNTTEHNPTSVPDQRLPHEVADTFRTALFKLRGQNRVLLFIDDVQWIDPASLHLLQTLPANSGLEPLSVFMTARSDQNHPIQPRLTAFSQDVRAENLTLSSLDPDSCRMLITEVTVDQPTATHTEILCSLAGGNPLVLLDLIRSWEAAGWSTTTVPDTLVSRLDRVISGITDFEKLLLAVIGTTDWPSSAELRQIFDEPIWRLTPSLAGLVTASLVVKKGVAYGFEHAMLRDASLTALGGTFVAEAHLLVAESLVRNQAEDPSQVAFHYRSAGDHESAGTWALKAAELATAKGALFEANRFYEYALESELVATNPMQIAEAGRIALSACHFEKGSHLLLRAAEMAETPNAMWAVDRLNGESEGGLRDHAEAAEEILAIAERYVEQQQPTDAVRAAESAIRVFERFGDWRSITSVLERFAQVIPHDEEGQVRRGMLLALGIVYGSPERAGLEARKAFDLAAGNPKHEAVLPKVAHRLFVVLLSEGRVATDLGQSSLQVLRKIGQQTANLKLQYTTLANEAVWHLDTGDLSRASELLDTAEEIVRGSSAQNELQNLATNRGYLYLRRDQPELALEYFEHARDLITSGTRGFLSDVVRAGIGLCHLRVGRLRNALIQLEEVGQYDYYYFDPTLLFRLTVECSWRKGRSDQAVEMLAELRSGIRESFVPQYLDLTLFEARLRSRLGQSEERWALAEEVRSIAQERSLSNFMTQAEAVARTARQ